MHCIARGRWNWFPLTHLSHKWFYYRIKSSESSRWKLIQLNTYLRKFSNNPHYSYRVCSDQEVAIETNKTHTYTAEIERSELRAFSWRTRPHLTDWGSGWARRLAGCKSRVSALPALRSAQWRNWVVRKLKHTRRCKWERGRQISPVDLCLSGCSLLLLLLLWLFVYLFMGETERCSRGKPAKDFALIVIRKRFSLRVGFSNVVFMYEEAIKYGNNVIFWRVWKIFGNEIR